MTTTVVYEEYIQSLAWQAKRQQKLADWDGLCYLCGSEPTDGVDIHHTTYRNLGHEPLGDLWVVCSGQCHQRADAVRVANQEHERWWRRVMGWWRRNSCRDYDSAERTLINYLGSTAGERKYIPKAQRLAERRHGKDMRRAGMLRSALLGWGLYPLEVYPQEVLIELGKWAVEFGGSFVLLPCETNLSTYAERARRGGR